MKPSKRRELRIQKRRGKRRPCGSLKRTGWTYETDSWGRVHCGSIEEVHHVRRMDDEKVARDNGWNYPGDFTTHYY